jgi:hypothetical protein
MPAAWKTFAALVVLAALGPAPLDAADPPAVVLPLTQFEVLGLVQQGLGDEAVIARLRETRSTFRLSANDAQMLKGLGVSNRVLAAMAGDTPRPVPPVVQAAAVAPAPAAPHVGTWVREFDGMQVVLRLTEKRLFATLNLAYAEEGKSGEVRMTFRADADYAVGPDGKVFGVITGTDYAPPKEVDAADRKWPKELTRMNGMPFCFRFRIDDGVLSASDLRCELPCESLPLLGRYARAEKEPGRTPTAYSTDPNIRMEQLLNQTEDIKPIGETAPAPRPVPPKRLHGGISG